MTTARHRAAHFGQAYRERQMAVRIKYVTKSKRDVILAMRKMRKRISAMYRLQAKLIRAALIPAFNAFTESTNRASEALSRIFEELKEGGYLTPIDEDYVMAGDVDEG